MKSFALKGDLCYSDGQRNLHTKENGYVICQDGISQGVYPVLPDKSLPVLDYTGKLILPGLVDLHIHAPQYSFRGLGMDLELLDWLDTHIFPEEAKYGDSDYADKAYTLFVHDLMTSATTRACIFATLHTDATLALMRKLEQSGLCTMVGKVNMDRNAPESLCEASAEQSIRDTRRWLMESKSYRRTTPILTPRFLPSCTDSLMSALGQLQRDTGLPVQSHLSENESEVAWIQELYPNAAFYGDAYDRFGLFGGSGCKTVMAHGVYSSSQEIERMAENRVFLAHCPASNANLSSGIAPVRRFLDAGVPVGLGSDVAGGENLSIFHAMAEAVKYSKLRWKLSDHSLPPLTFEEAFYLGTLGGGAFFGNVGTFDEGYEFDAVVLDDRPLSHPQPLTVRERLERAVYLSDYCPITAKFVAGTRIRTSL